MSHRINPTRLFGSLAYCVAPSYQFLTGYGPRVTLLDEHIVEADRISRNSWEKLSEREREKMATGSSEGKYSMPKLEGQNNWRTWKIQIKAVLMEKKLWTNVDGTARLANGADAPTREKFESQQHSAYTKLIMSMKPRWLLSAKRVLLV